MGAESDGSDDSAMVRAHFRRYCGSRRPDRGLEKAGAGQLPNHFALTMRGGGGGQT